MRTTSHRPTLGVIGPGKVGATLARALNAAGYRVQAVYARRASEAAWLSTYIKAEAVSTPADVIAHADLTLLTVPDDAIQPVAESIAGSLSFDITPGQKAVVHASGARDRHALAALAERGLLTGSLHPALPFADVETALAALPGTAFAIEAADPRLAHWLAEMVGAMKGRAIHVPTDRKALYHAALVIASNYTVTLYAIAQRLLIGLGAEAEAIEAALNAMMTATLANIETQGIPTALTGPLTRSDAGTLQAHLAALYTQPELAALYVALARQTYPLLAARGIDTTPIEKVFSEETASTHDTPHDS